MRGNRSVTGTTAIVFGLLLGGCAEHAAVADADPAVTLRRAVARTLDAKSFHIDGTIEFGDNEETGEIDYVAPDRFRSVEHGPGSTIRIVVGTDSYVSPGSGYPFTVSHIPEFSLVELVEPLGALRTADDVKLVGGSYRFTISDSIGQVVGEGEARIEDGVLASVSVRFGSVELRMVFSDYGADFVIDPPKVGAPAS